MRYQISGKQMDIGDALQIHVKSELDEVVSKYSQRPTEAIVVFSRNSFEYVCESTLHLSTGLNVSASSRSPEVYAAFEGCREKLDKQLRRYKRRLRDHHDRREQPVEFGGGSTYILATTDGPDEAEPDSLQPMIIAEMEARIPALSVGEAVMQMELAGANVLVFRNEKHSGVNVVYRRDDGNVGWIDPAKT